MEYQNQLEFIVAKLEQYLSVKRKRKASPRRLHYFIVGLPEADRTLPGRNEVLIYQNNPKFWRLIKTQLTQGRIKGVIPFESIRDLRNRPLAEHPYAEELELRPVYSKEMGFSFGKTELESKGPPTWDEVVTAHNAAYDIDTPRFVNRTHHPVIVIEKTPDDDWKLRQLGDTFGADIILATGNVSLTRTFEVCQRAKERDLPVVVLYFADLDPSGWDMSSSMLNNVKKIYPHDDHKLIRVGLLPEQAQAYNLEPNEIEKEISQKQLDRFKEATGTTTFYEMDAMDEDLILKLIEKELVNWAGRDKDREQFTKADELITDAINAINDQKHDLLADYEDDFEEYAEEITALQEEINEVMSPYLERMQELEERREQLTDDIEDRLYEESEEAIEEVMKELEKEEDDKNAEKEM